MLRLHQGGGPSDSKGKPHLRNTLQKKELAMIEKFLDNASDILLFGQDAPREFEDTWSDIRSVFVS